MVQARKQKIAMCIPTYNRQDVLKDTLEKYIDVCAGLGIDIYIYDSSTSDDTEKYCRRLKYGNLYHIRLDSSITLDEKVVKVFQCYQREKEYDYIWLSGDSMIYSERLLQKVCDAATEEPTVIFLNDDDRQKLGNRTYLDVKEMYRDLLWRSPLWGCILIKEELYRNVDWQKYKSMFVGTDQISVGLHWYRLADAEPFKGTYLVVEKKVDMFKSSTKKMAWWKGSAAGSEMVYRVWTTGLLTVLDNLPFDSQVTDEAILNIRKYANMFTIKNLCRSRKDGVYGKEIYEKYRAGLKRLTGHSDGLLRAIAVAPKLFMKILVKIMDKLS